MERMLSIVIPVRNGAATLGPLLDKLLDLRPPAGWRVEIVVGYQESNDGTLEILVNRGVRVVHCCGTGPSANRNAAVAASCGELLYFLDADACPLDDDFLSRLVQAAGRWHELGALGGPILIEPAQRNHPVALGDHYACWFCWHPHRPSGESFFQPSANLLIPRSVYLAAGGFAEDVQVLEDFDLECRIKQLGLKIYFDRSISITHHARSTLWRSWRHSWHWGVPVRETLYQRIERRYAFADQPRWFWINLPRLFLRRLFFVSIEAFRDCWWRTMICYPFLVATLAAWALAVAFGGRSRGAADRPSAQRLRRCA